MKKIQVVIVGSKQQDLDLKLLNTDLGDSRIAQVATFVDVVFAYFHFLIK
jgi:hypothetical protein